MGRSIEEKIAIPKANRILARLRAANPEWRSWRKQDFIRCQLEHSHEPRPRSHIEKVAVLEKFAERSGVNLAGVDKNKKRARSRPILKRYDGKNGFTEWRLVRYEALKRSQGRCECCGATPTSSGQPLHVDHIKPKSRYPKLEFEISNLQVLCADCNVGKGAWDETDWRDDNIIFVEFEDSTRTGKKL